MIDVRMCTVKDTDTQKITFALNPGVKCKEKHFSKCPFKFTDKPYCVNCKQAYQLARAIEVAPTIRQ